MATSLGLRGKGIVALMHRLLRRVARPATGLTLRSKGILAITVLILYVALISWFLGHARLELYAIVQQIETNNAKQAMLDRTFKILAHTLVETQALLSAAASSERRVTPYSRLNSHLAPVRANLDEAQQLYPWLAQDVGELQQAMFRVRAQPSALHLAEVRDGEQRLIAKLHDILTTLQERSVELAQRYHDRQQYINVVAVSANLLGALGSIAVIMIFFTRLANDIKRLQDRAVAIVAGYSGEPLASNRRDEVGGLIDAVNRMQIDLRRWEHQQEIGRQQRIHQEKMAAVGSLAAAIGHEVSNPIAAIAGVAQFMIGETKNDNRKISRLFHESASQILKQTERIFLILRQMATLTRPHSPNPEVLDLNGLIRSTCSFISYDQRFQGIEFNMQLDPNIPAVTAVADHVTQILMNLLINAADAMDHMSKDGRAKIWISTRRDGHAIHLAVSDNGLGMTPEVLARAFQDSFTTKPVGKGRGIGLFLCKTLIEEAGGRIELSSEQGAGTRASLYIPLYAIDRAAA